MQITVTGRHVEVTEDIKEYADQKVSKLPRFYDRLRHVEVVLDHESDEFTVEMIAKADGAPAFVAKEQGPDAFALIDLSVDKLERQVKKHKEKLRDPKHEPRDDSLGQV